MSTTFDIRKMGNDLGFNGAFIKYILGIPLEGEINVTNFKEAIITYENSPHGSDQRFLAQQKAEEFGRIELENATTLDDVINIYRKSPDQSELELLALKKAINLSHNFEEAMEVYGEIPDEGLIELKLSAKQKAEEFGRIELENATTLEDLLDIFHRLPADSKLEEFATKKIAPFYGWKEEEK